MTSPTRADRLVTAQGRYAGAVSRLLAYVFDVTAIAGLFAAALAVISYLVHVLGGPQVSWNPQNVVVGIVFAAWALLYFGYSWAASGKTLGMALLGIRVVRADGVACEPWRGGLRALVFPLSFLVFCLGFLGILVQREHRALHDLIAGTAVVYAWDARAARLRFLARQSEAGAAGDTGPSTILRGLPGR